MFWVNCQRPARRVEGLVLLAGQQVVEAIAGDQARVKRIEFQGTAAFVRGLLFTAAP